MTEKRRKVERVRTSIPVEWGVTRDYQRHGKLVSLSTKGCLLQTEHVEPLYGKTLHLRFPLPDDEWMTLQGRVIYYLREVGFAVEFDEIPDAEHYLLARLVEDYHNGDPYKSQDELPLRVAALLSDAPAPIFKEQRKQTRAKVSININWGMTPDCEYSGDKVTSLSLTGCFIQTERKLEEGMDVYIRLWEMPGGKGVFKGTVRYQLQLSPKHLPIGIGLEFHPLSPEDTTSLQDVLNFYGESPPT